MSQDTATLAAQIMRITPADPKRIDTAAIARQIVESTDPTLGDYATELPKAVAEGAVRGTGMALTGAGKLVSIVGPDAVGDPIANAGMALSKMGPEVDPRIAESFPGQVAGGIGTSLPVIAATGLTAGFGGGATAVGIAGGTTGVAIEGGGGYQEAISRGGTEEQARNALLLTAPLGALDAFAPGTGQGSRIGRAFARGTAALERAGLAGKLADAALKEGFIETVQGKGENVAQRIAGTIGDEEEARGILEIARQEGLPAAVGSVLVEAVTRWATGGKARGTIKRGSPEAVSVESATATPNVASGGAQESGGSVAKGEPLTSEDARIDVPGPEVQEAVDRLMSRPEVQGRTPLANPVTAEVFAAPAELADRAAALGARVVIVKPSRQIDPQGAYDRQARTIILNADAGPIEQQRALFRHELTHFAADTAPDVYQDLAAALDVVAPGLIDRQSANREGRQRAITSKKEIGPALSPDLAREEGVAELLQQIPTFEELVRTRPDVAFKVATYQPGIVRRVADVLIDLAHAVGIAKNGSVGKLIREIEATLKTPVEKLMGVKRGTQLALKVAELEKAMRLATPIPKPVGNIAPTKIAPRASLPVVEADPSFPRPIVQTKADRAALASRQDVGRAQEATRAARARAEADAASKAEKLAASLQAKAEARATDLEARAAKSTGTARRRFLREAEAIRGAIEAAQAETRQNAPKRVGDIVEIPGGTRARVTAVKGDTVRVLTLGPKRLGDPETTLGVPELRSRVVLAKDARLVSRAGEEVGAKAPSASDRKAAEREAAEKRRAAAAEASAKAKADREAAREAKSATKRADKPTELPFDTATGGHATGERIDAAVPHRYDDRLKDPEIQGQLRYMARNEAGQNGVGGIRKRARTVDQGDEYGFGGVTNWEPKSQWWRERPTPSISNPKTVVRLVEKAIAGKYIGPAQRELLSYMLDVADGQRASANAPSAIDVLLGTGSFSEDAAERAAIQDDGQDVIDEPADTETPFALPFNRKGESNEDYDPGFLRKLRANVRERMKRIGQGGSEVERPLANTSDSAQARRLAEAVQELRLETADRHTVEEGVAQLAELEKNDPEGLGTLQKLLDGTPLNVAETLQAQRIRSEDARTAFKTHRAEDMDRAIAVEFAYDEARSQASAILRAAQDVYATPQERFLSTLFSVTSKARERMRKAKTAAQRDRIVAAERKKIEKALFALKINGFDVEVLTSDYFKDGSTYNRMADIAARAKGDFWDWFYAWRSAGMQFGTLGPVRNAASNAAHIAYDNVFSKALSSTPAETKRYLYDMIHAVPEALKHAGSAWRWGERAGTSMDEFTKAPGWLGLRYIELGSTNINAAQDVFFRHILVQAEVRSAARAIAKETGRSFEDVLLDPKVIEEAEAAGRRGVFADRDKLTSALNSLRGIADVGKFSPGRIVVPFLSTPTQIVRRSLETAGGPVVPLVRLGRDVAGLEPMSRDKRLREMGRALVGAGLWAMVYALSQKLRDDDQPWITGSRKVGNAGDQQDRSQPAYSFTDPFTGDYRSYQSVDPLATAIPQMLDVLRGDSSVLESFAATIKDKSFFRSLDQLYQASTDDNSGKLGKYIRSTLWEPMIPNAVRTTIARQEDTKTKELSRTNAEALAPKRLAYGATGADVFAPPLRYDRWGREDKKIGRSWAARQFALFPTTRAEEEIERVDVLLAKYRDQHGKRVAFGAPPPNFVRNGVTIQMTEEQYADFTRVAGREALESIRQWIDAKDSLDDDDVKRIRAAISKAEKRYKNRLAEGQR